MYNLHPPLSAFPFALLCVVAAFEAGALIFRNQALKSAAKLNLVVAAVFIVCAFFSGYYAADNASITFKVEEDLITRHQFYGRLLLFLILPCLALGLIHDRAQHGREYFRAAYLLTLAGCVGLVIFTGYLGASLVFKHGAGIEIEGKVPASLPPEEDA